MNLTLRIFLTIIVLALNVLLYDKHSNGALHILQLIIEIAGLSLFSYYIIKLDAPNKFKLVICALLFTIFKYSSIVIFKYLSGYFPVFTDKYKSYMVIGFFAVAIIVYLRIERDRNKQVISDFNINR